MRSVWPRCSRAKLRWCLSVGFAATLPDTFLQLLLVDSRLSMHRHAVALEAQVSFEMLEQLPAEAWRVLSRAYNLPAADLRDAAIKSSCTALGYLEWRVFSVLGSPPWSYLEDGPKAAVATLQAATECPEEMQAQGRQPQEPSAAPSSTTVLDTGASQPADLEETHVAVDAERQQGRFKCRLLQVAHSWRMAGSENEPFRIRSSSGHPTTVSHRWLCKDAQTSFERKF